MCLANLDRAGSPLSSLFQDVNGGEIFVINATIPKKSNGLKSDNYVHQNCKLHDPEMTHGFSLWNTFILKILLNN